MIKLNKQVNNYRTVQTTHASLWLNSWGKIPDFDEVYLKKKDTNWKNSKKKKKDHASDFCDPTTADEETVWECRSRERTHERSIMCDDHLPLWCTSGKQEVLFCKNPKRRRNGRRLKTWQNVLLTAGEHWGLNGKMTACLHGNASIMGVGCWICLFIYFFERFQVVTVCHMHIVCIELANSNEYKRMLQSQTDVFSDVEQVWSG